MGLVINPFTGFLDITGGSTAIISGSTPIVGGTPNAFLYDHNGTVGEIGPLTNGQVFIGSTGASAVPATLTGTTNEVIVTNGAGSITLSTPQAIATTSSPTFSDVTLTSLTPAGVVLNNVSGLLSTGQVNLTTNISGVLPIANGGTNSSAALSGNKAIISNGSAIVESATTSTEIGYVSGVTSSIQTQLNAKVNTSSVGVANGVASLDSGGKVPVAQLPNTVMEYQGAWNPSTNTPALSDGTGTNGNVYYVSTAFSGTVSGLTDPSMTNFQVGDIVIYSSSVGKWQLTTPAAGVQSVNGQQGVVVLTTTNISEGTNLYYTNLRAENAVGGILANSTNVSLTYSGGNIKGDLIATGVTAASYGSATTVPTIAIDTNGRITSASSTTITGTTPGGSAGGDLSGSYPNPSVAKIQGKTVSGTAPTDAQWLVYNGTQYNPVSMSADATLADTGAITLASTGVSATTYGSATTSAQIAVDVKGRITSASSVTITGTTPGGSAGGDLSGTYPNPTVAKIHGTSVSASTPTDAQFLVYNTSGTQYNPVSMSADATLADTGALTLAASGVSANTYGSSNAIPVLTIDSKGRVTSATTTSIGSAGDLSETSFSGANNVSSAANVTGLAFANATVRAFRAQVSIFINATSSLYQTMTLVGVQRGSDWAFSQTDMVGDTTVTFSITAAGQVQYLSPNTAGFTAMTIKYRAATTSI